MLTRRNGGRRWTGNSIESTKMAALPLRTRSVSLAAASLFSLESSRLQLTLGAYCSVMFNNLTSQIDSLVSWASSLRGDPWWCFSTRLKLINKLPEIILDAIHKTEVRKRYIFVYFLPLHIFIFVYFNISFINSIQIIQAIFIFYSLISKLGPFYINSILLNSYGAHCRVILVSYSSSRKL